MPWPACLPVVFLRHPLLRARSVQEFIRRDPAFPFARVATDNDFAGYVRWALRRERGSIVVRNYQVVHLSQASWRSSDILEAEACVPDLTEATELLTRWGVAGIVESFGLSMQVFQARYGATLPGLDLRDVHSNVNSSVSGSVADRIAQCRDLLGAKLYSDFMAMNALDVALYDHAVRILDKAARQVSNMQRF